MKHASHYIGKDVFVKMDRPLGSKHPRDGFSYPVNYGYVPGTVSGDGEELDAYVLGVDRPLDEFFGMCIAVIHRTNDDDDKLVVVPVGMNLSDADIERLTYFQEQWFKHAILRAPVELISIADLNDKVIGHHVRGDKMPDGWCAQIAAVLVFNAKGELIIQKIAVGKGKDEGKWSYSAAGHVDAGETYEQAAIRELKEELGIDGTLAGCIGRTTVMRKTGQIGAFHRVFKVFHDGPYHPDPAEISEIKAVPLSELFRMIASDPSQFKSQFIDIFKMLPK